MKNLQHKIPLAMMLLALLAMVSCRKDKDILTTIGGVIEDSPVEDDSKVYLSDRERWLRWETGDEIFVWASSSENGLYRLDNASNTHLTGTFSSDNSNVTANSTIYAFYPPTLATNGNGIGSDNMRLFWPRSHKYRQNSDATDPDSSFGKGAMPMVAYRPEHDAHELFFHSLAGILRFQLYAGPALTDEEGDEFTINTITFEARDENLVNADDTSKQLSGLFNITKLSIQDNKPQITPTSFNAEDRMVSITDINKTIGGTKEYKDTLFTFYLPLPAVADPYGTGPHKTTYHLKMHVIGTQNNGTVNKYFVRTLKVDIRRLSVTMMQAMQIDSLSTKVGGTGSVGSPTIVGCGTEARPFQIYNADQLVYLRNRCNADQRVNGQKITKDTYIKICRSTITLVPEGTVLHGSPDTAVWTTGFNNFTGHLYFSSSAGETGGIKNISGHPIFNSIGTDGVVEELYVKYDTVLLTSGSGTFSPMCNINNGKMIDCHNRCMVISTSGHNLAGLCCTNNGTITGGANDALLITNGNVAGICCTNSVSGKLQGNFTLSSAVPDGSNIAGICFYNSGLVQNCQVSANITNINSSGNWGVVVFNNSGTVTNCRSVGTVIFTTSGSIGGVVNTNTGTVDGCSLNVTLRGGSGSVGGIVAVMNGGEVRNCYAKEGDVFIYGIPRSGASNHADYAGGIVGHLHNGVVKNCYNRCSVIGATNSGAILGRIDEDATIENCWSDLATLGFLGDVSIRDDQGEIGPFCFSAKTTDTNLNCVLLIKNWYRIKVPWHIKHKVDLAVAAAGGRNLEGSDARFQDLYNAYYSTTYDNPPNPSEQATNDVYLFSALNHWVQTYKDEAHSYWSLYCRSWTTNIGLETHPLFTESSTTKLYRKQRYPHRR